MSAAECALHPRRRWIRRVTEETLGPPVPESAFAAATVSRAPLLAGAGVVTLVIGLVKTIEPMMELGVALVVMAMITNPKPKP
jgi:hypothetical protein